MADRVKRTTTPTRRPYHAPSVSSVRLETKRTQLTFMYATGATHCSFHYHDTNGTAGTTQDCSL
jgi:hypothetical protein